MRWFWIFLIWCVVSSTAALAVPVNYALETEGSQVQFRVAFGSGEISGTMPVEAANLALDFDRASNSEVSVVLAANGARANFPFATEALRGPSVLNTASHPSIRFQSTGFEAQGNRAEVAGLITIRGVTRPVVLNAEIFREAGQGAGDRSRLLVRMSTAIARSEFGADGWASAVGDIVTINILARIRREE
ncbi:MAG: YceI family protein [Pseudomonadota bacterium]